MVFLLGKKEPECKPSHGNQATGGCICFSASSNITAVLETRSLLTWRPCALAQAHHSDPLLSAISLIDWSMHQLRGLDYFVCALSSFDRMSQLQIWTSCIQTLCACGDLLGVSLTADSQPCKLVHFAIGTVLLIYCLP